MFVVLYWEITLISYLLIRSPVLQSLAQWYFMCDVVNIMTNSDKLCSTHIVIMCHVIHKPIWLKNLYMYMFMFVMSVWHSLRHEHVSLILDVPAQFLSPKHCILILLSNEDETTQPDLIIAENSFFITKILM
jgi:hypothetical protein